MSPAEIDAIDWAKGGDLVPVVVQHADTRAVLMLAYMNRAALERSLAERRLTFFSRTRQRLWTKGETSGHFIALESIALDCDRDTLLATGRPVGPVCHTGAADCFAGAAAASSLAFLPTLEATIAARIAAPSESSYVARLCAQGPLRVAQKVAEEGSEVALAAVAQGGPELVGEAADLLFHLMVLLRSRGHSLSDVATELEARHRGRARTAEQRLPKD